MRAVVWISEASWQRCVDHARAALPPDAEVTLLHVAAADAEHLVDHPPGGWLGRHRPPPPRPSARQIGDAEARELLKTARERLGRPAGTVARRGRVEHEVLAETADADVLVLARDGEPRPGPKSLGPKARFVVDHARCDVLLVTRSESSPPPPGPAPRSPAGAS